MKKKNIVLFSTESSLYFAKLIAKGLGIDVGTIHRKTFGGVERYYRLGIDNRDDLMGKTAIFVGSTHTDDDINELYRVGCSLANLGTVRRIFVIPFFGYSTMERAKYAGEVVTAKVMARQLSSIPNSGLGNVFLLMDLHVSGLVHYFEGDCLRYELRARNYLIKAIEQLRLENFMFGSADMGRPGLVADLAKHFKTGLALIDKDREFEKTEVTAVVGDVKGKNVIMLDDMTRSGSTIIKGAEAYIGNGAIGAYAALSHYALNDDQVACELSDSPIKILITTNTHPMSKIVTDQTKDDGKLIVCDVSSEFVNAINKILL